MSTTIHVADAAKITCEIRDERVLCIRLGGERTDCLVEIVLRSPIEARTATTLVESAIAMRISAEEKGANRNG